VRDGAAAERELRAAPYAAAVLDLGLPRLDGIDVLGRCARRLQRAGAGADRARRRDDRMRGLDRGADDYVIKPIDLLELGARLRALVRACHGQAQGAVRVQDIELDVAARRVSRDGRRHRAAAARVRPAALLLLNAAAS
jgi:two-component system response regulator QseB